MLHVIFIKKKKKNTGVFTSYEYWPLLLIYNFIKYINKYKLKCQSFFFIIMVLCNSRNDLRKKQLNYIILKVKGRNDGRKNISCKLFNSKITFKVVLCLVKIPLFWSRAVEHKLSDSCNFLIYVLKENISSIFKSIYFKEWQSECIYIC